MTTTPSEVRRMKKVRNGIRVGLALATLLLGVHSGSAGQLNLVPLLQISGQYSDNVFFAPANQQSDTFFIINPGIAIDYASSFIVTSLAYQAGFQRHTEFKERDNNVHRFDGTIGLNFQHGLTLNVTDNLYITNDPLAFDASGDRIQRDSFKYNRISPTLSYTVSSDVKLSARFDRTDLDYDTLIDSHQNAYGGSLTAKLGARSTVAADYFQYHRRFVTQAPQFNVADYDGRRYGVRLDRRISPRLSANLFVGYEERKYVVPGPLEDFDSVLLDLQLSGEFPDVFSWTIAASQRLNDLAIRGAYKVRRANLDLRKSFGERLRMEFGGFAQTSRNKQIPEDADYYGFRIEAQYMVAKFLNIWLGYDYLDRTSPNINPFTENRINFGLTLSYGL